MSNLILFRGLPCVGKTTLSLSLCRRLGIPLLAKDDIRDSLVRYDKDINEKAGQNIAESNNICYDVLLNLVKTQLMCGLDVIVESPLGRRILFDEFYNLAQQFRGKVFLIDCVLDMTIWKQRLSKRAHELPTGHRPSDPNQILEYYGENGIQFECQDRSNTFYLKLDMDNTLEHLVDKIVDWLSIVKTS